MYLDLVLSMGYMLNSSRNQHSTIMERGLDYWEAPELVFPLSFTRWYALFVSGLISLLQFTKPSFSNYIWMTVFNQLCLTLKKRTSGRQFTPLCEQHFWRSELFFTVTATHPKWTNYSTYLIVQLLSLKGSVIVWKMWIYLAPTMGLGLSYSLKKLSCLAPQ